MVIATTDSNVSFEENVISAPSTPANQGFVTQGFRANPGANVNCNGNVIVGYGGEGNNPGCLAADNNMQ